VHLAREMSAMGHKLPSMRCLTRSAPLPEADMPACVAKVSNGPKGDISLNLT
jgi:hypothetical protein